MGPQLTWINLKPSINKPETKLNRLSIKGGGMRWLKSYSELAHLRTQLKSPAHAKSNTTCALGSRITCALKSGITCALKTRIACALNGQWSGGASYVNIWGVRWKIIIHQHMPGRVGTHHTIYAGSDGRSSYINLWGVGWGHTWYINRLRSSCISM